MNVKLVDKKPIRSGRTNDLRAGQFFRYAGEEFPIYTVVYLKGERYQMILANNIVVSMPKNKSIILLEQVNDLELKEC